MGVGDGHRVVVYDSHGVYSAPRVWWLFRLFGKTDVAVLDGGLPKWTAEGRPLEDGWPMLRDRHFTARRNASLVRDVTQVAATAKLGDAQIVDARSPARFRGEAPEPRAGLKGGHMPGALNAPAGTLIRDSRLLPPDELRTAFDAAGVDLAKPLVTTCGSGVTAAHQASASAAGMAAPEPATGPSPDWAGSSSVSSVGSSVGSSVASSLGEPSSLVEADGELGSSAVSASSVPQPAASTSSRGTAHSRCSRRMGAMVPYDTASKPTTSCSTPQSSPAIGWRP